MKRRVYLPAIWIVSETRDSAQIRLYRQIWWLDPMLVLERGDQLQTGEYYM